jgi:hypothetical protein
LEFGALRNFVVELTSIPRLDLAAENKHVGSIERNIRFLKKKVRSLRHTLPFEMLPPVMLVCMVQVVTPIMNLFPRSGGTHYLPSMIMTDGGLSMDQLRLKFDSYVQVAENQGLQNSMHSRTQGAIALGPMNNLIGGQVFMALDTGKLIRRFQWTEIPKTQQVKDCVKELAAGKNWMLTFKNKHGKVIGDGPGWTAPGNDNSIDNPPPKQTS